MSHQHQLQFLSINSDFFQIFITVFHFMRWSKQGLTHPILTLKSNIFLHNSSTSTLISFETFITGFHFMSSFYERSKQGVTTLYLFQNLTFSLISQQHQLWFLSNLYNSVSCHDTIQTRRKNPILTLKPKIFLHIASTSTLISFKP